MTAPAHAPLRPLPSPLRPLRPLRPMWTILLVTLAAGAVVAGFLVLGALVGEGFGYFSKEPAETFRVPRYIGWEAYSVVLVEAAGTFVALFAGFMVRRLRGPGHEASFLLAAGGFSLLLLVDDFFQFHDYVYARLFGIQEQFVYPVYALLALGIAWRWGRHVAREGSSLMLLAGVWLAVSVGIDQVVAKTWPYFHVVEDGGKLIGLSLWAAFLVRTSTRLLTDSVDLRRTGGGGSAGFVADVERTLECLAVAPAPVRTPEIPQPRVAVSTGPADDAARSPGAPAGAPPAARPQAIR